jgi:hypothetical protein
MKKDLPFGNGGDESTLPSANRVMPARSPIPMSKPLLMVDIEV